MKFLTLILMLPILSLSQEICDVSRKISEDYYIKKDVSSVINQLNALRDSESDDGLKLIIDYSLAEIYYKLNKIKKSKLLFEKIYNSKFVHSKQNNDCDYSFFVNEKVVSNLLKGDREWRIKVRCLEYISQINYRSDNYVKALEDLEKSLKEKRKYQKIYTCATAAYQDIMAFERKRFDILKKLKKDKQANHNAIKVLFLPTMDNSFAQKILTSFRTEYPDKNIIKEIRKSINNISFGEVSVNGINKEMYYINLLDNKIVVTYTHTSEQNTKNYLNSRLEAYIK